MTAPVYAWVLSLLGLVVPGILAGRSSRSTRSSPG